MDSAHPIKKERQYIGTNHPLSSHDSYHQEAQPSVLRILQDSGLGSFDSGQELSPPSVTSHKTASYMAALNDSGLPELDNTAIRHSEYPAYMVAYLGSYNLDRRYTQSMLPWVIGAVRSRGERKMVSLEVLTHSVRAIEATHQGPVITLQHPLHTLYRYIT